ncbi:DUF3616 domain-containing protein [Silanimonas sp.]|jgi:hypothetical protein|uniref:DUF3616 domain-containing protein n=1 Tax=Silanimonas sp. TaxID=1929290 RepID=UPI0037CB7BFC
MTRSNPSITAMSLCCATLALASPAIASEPRFIGACDASAAVTLTGGALLVASDEDNLLRAYAPGRPEPLFQLDVSPMLGGPALREEADLEGATRIDDRLYWIASHGADKNGRRRAARHALFAMRELERDGRVALVPIGTVHTGLIEALARHPALRDVPLAEAAKLPPKQEGALNIEALGADPDGRLWIGFRNPIPDGKALLVPLHNPGEVIEAAAQPVFGDPVRLDLGGLGLRSMEYSPALQSWLLVGGPIDDGGRLQVFRWTGDAAAMPTAVPGLAFDDLQPEALVLTEDGLLLLSDDGTRPVAGGECKDAPVGQRAFRYLEVRLRPAD